MMLGSVTELKTAINIQESESLIRKKLDRLPNGYVAENGVSFETLKTDTGLSSGELERILETMQNKNEIEPCPDMPRWYRKPVRRLKMLDPSNTDFITICREILEDKPIYYDRTGLFWIWSKDRKCWEIQDETDILNEIYDKLLFAGLVDKRDKLIAAMKMVARKNKPLDKPKTWIQFADVVYDLDNDITFTPDSTYFYVNPLPWRLGDSEETPNMDRLFTEWVGQEDKIMLEEMLAYCILEDYPIHRLFGLIGSGRNGKGTFLRLIDKFVGSQNSTSTSLDRLRGSRFEAAKLYKKTVAFVGETNFTEIKESALLKSLTGQDLTSGEFKNKAPFDFYNYAKLIIATNSLPITHDKTVGYYSRWILIDFPNRFDAGRDVLIDIPDFEYENLGKKCINLLVKLLKRGTFTKEKNIEDKAKDYEEKSNPLVVFISKKCEKDSYASLPLWQFCEKFMPYLTQNGYRMMSNKEITTTLRDMGYTIKLQHYTKEDGSDSTWNVISNLAFKQEVSDIQDTQDIQLSLSSP